MPSNKSIFMGSRFQSSAEEEEKKKDLVESHAIDLSLAFSGKHRNSYGDVNLTNK